MRPLVPATLGLLGGIGVLLPEAWFLAPLAVSGLLYRLWFAANTARHAALEGGLLGFGLAGGGVWWMWSMVPLHTFISPDPAAQYAAVTLVWGVTALLGGLASAFAALALYAIRASALAPVAAACIWVLQEYVRMWLYAFYSFAPQSLLGAHFSQTMLGYPLAESAFFLRFAQLGGGYTLTFVAALVAGVLAVLAHTAVTRRTGVGSVLALFILVVLVATPLLLPQRTPPALGLTLALLGADSTTTEVRTELGALATSKTPPDVIVVPEGGRFLLSQEELASLFPQEVLFIGSEHVAQDGAQAAELVYRSSAHGDLARYRKIFLMPQGEYLPSIAKSLFWLVGDPTLYAQLDTTGARLLRGTTTVAISFKGVGIGGLICSDLLSPSLYRSLSKERPAGLLVNVANPDWFHGSRAFSDKMLQIARVHAVESNAYFALVSAGADSFLIAPDGTLLNLITGQGSILRTLP